MVVIGDVHGCYKTLVALLEKIPEKPEDIVFVGDLIDRGPRSKEVVNLVRDKGYRCVKGNHEDMMACEWGNIRFRSVWMSNGGSETISSYNNDEKDLLDAKEWMFKLPVYLELPESKNKEGRMLVVSHSCIIPYWEHRDNKTVQWDIMWSRDEHHFKPIPEIYNVHGHTPKFRGPEIELTYANIDTGCCFNGVQIIGEGLVEGKLTALRFPEMEIIEQLYID